MAANDPSELLDPAESDRGNGGKTRAALIVAVLAALLAISGYGGSNATKDALKEDIAASNLYAFYQARKIRHTAYQLAADNLEAARAGAADAAARAELARLVKSYRNQAASLESKPETNDGMKELLERVKQREQARDEALKRDPYFDYAAALMQIAIITISVSVITGTALLLWGGVGLGAVGFLSMLNGFFLFFG